MKEYKNLYTKAKKVVKFINALRPMVWSHTHGTQHMGLKRKAMGYQSAPDSPGDIPRETEILASDDRQVAEKISGRKSRQKFGAR